MKIISGKTIIKILQKQGFMILRQKGSHVHLIKNIENKEFHVTVPVHANKDLNPFVMRSVIRQAGYSIEEFEKLI